jgi:hypothetical protein
MLRRDLGIEATLEAGPYGSFEVRVDDEVIADGGALRSWAFFPRSEIRSKAAERRDGGAPPGAQQPDDR